MKDIQLPSGVKVGEVKQDTKEALKKRFVHSRRFFSILVYECLRFLTC